MPREGAIIFRDLAGKLGMLRIECDKCGRAGNYRLARLIAKYGIDAKLFDCSDRLRRTVERDEHDEDSHDHRHNGDYVRCA
jgi:hypothetical protein